MSNRISAKLPEISESQYGVNLTLFLLSLSWVLTLVSFSQSLSDKRLLLTSPPDAVLLDKSCKSNPSSLTSAEFQSRNLPLQVLQPPHLTVCLLLGPSLPALDSLCSMASPSLMTAARSQSSASTLFLNLLLLVWKRMASLVAILAS
jgi:hypothetical protein